MSSAADLPSQDLVIYSDGSITAPPNIAFGKEHTFNLLLYTEFTKCTWFEIALMQNSLLDICYINSTTSHQDSYCWQNPKCNVLFASFGNGSEVYFKQFQKYMKIDMTRGNGAFKFITFLEEDIEKWFDILQMEAAKLTQDKSRALNIFLEDPQLLLFLKNYDEDEIISRLAKLNEIANIYVTAPSDKSLLQFTQLSDDLATVYTSFIMKLLHRSNLIVRLKPLKTGRAEDITGELIINKGVIDHSKLQVLEREYLYVIGKEGSVKLFYR